MTTTPARSAVRTAGPAAFPETLHVIDSHTAGEPTRVIIDGWPPLGGATMLERRAELRATWDHLRAAVVCEPRGHDAVVGALLTPPVSAGAVAGVVFFNNIGYLGMCGHGMIGVVQTLAHLGRVGAGELRLDTPAGTVGARLAADGSITIMNVASYCHARDVSVTIDGVGRVTGDIAYGGNWFFITRAAVPLELGELGALLHMTRSIRTALGVHCVAGPAGEEIDHIALWAPAPGEAADACNFVLCPGGAYDRSPCGTGLAAQLAVLHARGALEPGREWRVRSITGGELTGWLERDGAELVPHIRGRAHITAEATLHFDEHDPLRAGFTARA